MLSIAPARTPRTDPTLRPTCPTWCTADHRSDFATRYSPRSWIYLHEATIGTTDSVIVEIMQSAEIRDDGSLVEVGPVRVQLLSADRDEMSDVMSTAAAERLGALLLDAGMVDGAAVTSAGRHHQQQR